MSAVGGDVRVHGGCMLPHVCKVSIQDKVIAESWSLVAPTSASAGLNRRRRVSIHIMKPTCLNQTPHSQTHLLPGPLH